MRNKFIFILVVLALFSSVRVNASYHYKITAIASAPTGKGKVYASNSDSDTPNWNVSTTEAQTTMEGDQSYWNPLSQTLYLYAQPETAYEFKGWGTSEAQTTGLSEGNPLGVTFSSTESEASTDWKKTRYAIFSPIQYRITYEPGSGTVPGTNPQSYDIESSDVIRTPSRDGYNFDVWKVTSETSGSWEKNNPVSAGTTLTGNYGDVTLTAQWTPIEYSITFSANGGTGTDPTQIEYTIEETVTLPSNPYFKTGCEFSGWKPASAVGNWKTSENYAAGATVTTGKYGNVTLAAQWDEFVDIVISVSGLKNGESAIFTVAKGDATLYTVALSSTKSTITIKKQLPAEYTVTPLSWSWTYSMTAPITKTISSSDHTFSFTANKDTDAKEHAEKSNVNWKP